MSQNEANFPDVFCASSTAQKFPKPLRGFLKICEPLLYFPLKRALTEPPSLKIHCLEVITEHVVGDLKPRGDTLFGDDVEELREAYVFVQILGYLSRYENIQGALAEHIGRQTWEQLNRDVRTARGIARRLREPSITGGNALKVSQTGECSIFRRRVHIADVDRIIRFLKKYSKAPAYA